MIKYKKLIIFLVILIVLSPLGLMVPKLFNADGAWGEWSIESVKEQTGIEPKGMKNDATLYKAPIDDYNLSDKNNSLSQLSVSYIISGVIGTGIILILTFGTVKLMSRNKKDDTSISA
jgi:cobalt/nickel transport protein